MFRDFVMSVYKLKQASSVLPMGMPASLFKKDLPTVWAMTEPYVTYVASPKADGVRMLLGCLKGQGFMMNRSEAFETAPWFRTEGDTLLDCEVCDKLIWIFDALCVNGHNIIHTAYHMRLSAAAELVGTLSNTFERFRAQPNRSVLPKPGYYTFTPFRMAIKPIWPVHELAALMDWCNHMNIGFDGIVYTPLTRPAPMFRTVDMFKWKPVEQCTVDFLIRRVNATHMDLFVVDEKCKEELFARIESNETILDGRVYECQWSGRQWCVVKLRHDKKIPNAKFTVEQTCLNISEKLSWMDCIPK